MCAETVTTHVNLELNSTSNTNTQDNDGIITLPYTEVAHVKQAMASR